ncbi:O-antigen ligase family protein [Gymnodinialimonas ulvae]|uniref:O-antigen ligase family protein n=1 Tax=Gymnodinialimonas ulvae TaxID=3126504 RepID=UPI00309AEB3C
MTSQVNPPGPSLPGRSGALNIARETLSKPVVLALFIACATQPYGLALGPLLIGPYRLVLLLIGPILMIQWLSGRYGRLLPPDFLVLGYATWVLVALAANGQMGRVVEWGGSQFIDTFFAYLLGRAAIRTKQDFYFFTRVFLWVLLFLLPFAILESAMGVVILIRLAEAIPLVEAFGIVTLEYPPRLGLLRAQTGAVHPILYGVMCAMGFSFGLLGLAHSPGKPGLFKRFAMTSGSYVGTFFSLSSGAFAAVGVQGLLMLWNWLLRKWKARWKVLGWGFVVAYIIVDFVAARPPALVFGRMISFSGSTAWNRYMIWQFGSAEVMRNPIFGMGIFSDWQRAPWMPSSIDNQWLQVAMRFGLVGIGLLMGAYIYILYKLIRIDFSNNPEMDAIRKAFVFTLIALLISYGTVAAWHIQWSILLLLLGATTWIFSTPPEAHGTDEDENAAPADGRRGATQHARPIDAPRYSRFPTQPRDKPPGR